MARCRLLIVLLLSAGLVTLPGCGWQGEDTSRESGSDTSHQAAFRPSGSIEKRQRTAVSKEPYRKRINFAYDRDMDAEPDTRTRYTTPSPPGWETYYGSRYTAERGYGWLTDLRGKGRDRGLEAEIILSDGVQTTVQALGRPELATYQDRHNERELLVFRVDIPNGWYRVSCSSVDPGTSLPHVDQRSFKCRAHDVVFAGADTGAAVAVAGEALVEGSGVAEATDGHLRIVVGDPAYGGWTWTYPGPLWTNLRHWWRREYNYYSNWRERLTRTLDPGFHALRLNALEIEAVAPPSDRPALVFRDFFNRDDAKDINIGLDPTRRWQQTRLQPNATDTIQATLYKTALKVLSLKPGVARTPSVAGWLQTQLSPASGVLRYSTRVSLYTGAGSRRHSGLQEAGLALLMDPDKPTEFRGTFVGVAFDGRRAEAKGRLVYRVGDGKSGYRTRLEVPDTDLPITIADGEHELIVEHNVTRQVLTSIRINGVEVASRWPLSARVQPRTQGLYGLRSAMQSTDSKTQLQQFYWYYRVEALDKEEKQG